MSAKSARLARYPPLGQCSALRGHCALAGCAPKLQAAPQRGCDLVSLAGGQVHTIEGPPQPAECRGPAPESGARKRAQSAQLAEGGAHF